MFNFLIGNNRIATQAVLDNANLLGYDFTAILSNSVQGEAYTVGSIFAFLSYILLLSKSHIISKQDITAQFVLQFSSKDEFFNRILQETSDRIDVLQGFLHSIESWDLIGRGLVKLCLISGGETVVTLTRGKFDGQKSMGGRNMEMALAYEYVLNKLINSCVYENSKVAAYELLFSSYGTDGIDGPTDSAGAFVQINSNKLHENAQFEEMEDFLLRHDSYNFYSKCGRLVNTGPTGTNVSDLQVLLVNF